MKKLLKSEKFEQYMCKHDLIAPKTEQKEKNNVKKIKTTEKCFEKCDDLKKTSVIKLQVVPEKYNEKNNITQKKKGGRI
ncbi:hypothetical protein COBT_003972 [Conglomerata obtusa]